MNVFNILYFSFPLQEKFDESFKAKDWKEKAAFNSLLVTGAFLGGLAALRLLMK